MNRFEELIKSVSAMPSVIVHLGAGTCGECESYKSKDADRVIYVEPNQYLAETATETFSDTSHVKVIPHAIAAENGPQTLNITNNWRFSSLLLPGELLGYYPNIEVDDKVEVEVITLTKLCQDEEISKDSDNLLVAELQGMEKEVFPSTEIETLQRFKWIIIRSSAINLYTPVSDNTQISLPDAMKNAGFRVLVFEEDSPPFTNILCLRNEATIENIPLKTDNTSLLETVRVLELKQSEELSQLRTQVQSVMAEKENPQQQFDEHLKTIDAESVELDKAQSLIKSLTEKKNTQRKKIKTLSKTIKAKSVRLEKVENQIQSVTAKKDNQQEQIKELVEANKEKLNEIAKMQQTLRINSKLVLKSNTDLKDLQIQYRTALQHQEQQHTLLSELREKLRQASAYYQKLNLQNLVLDVNILEQEDPDNIESTSDSDNGR